MTTVPDDPLAAVSHPNPYPYYADLVAHRPLYRDARLGLWVASSAEVVAGILSSDRSRVRPSIEPIPEALRGTPAGLIFGQLVRFNDGASHGSLKSAVSVALEAATVIRAADLSIALAKLLAQEFAPTRDPGRLARFAFALPVYVVASLLGIPHEMLSQTAGWASDFARGLAPGSDIAQIARGIDAAGQLLNMFRTVAPTLNDETGTTLLDLLAQEARRVGCEAIDDVIIANSIGFLFQTYDATAGLIGNTLLALASQPEVYARVVADVGLLPQVIDEVLRFDPPVQNTRRFAAGDLSIAGQKVQKGDGILVILAAASRDPSANSHPERFDIFRPERRTFTFGAGAHACPGATLAAVIARAGIAQLLTSEADPQRLARRGVFRPSHNVRIALSRA